VLKKPVHSEIYLGTKIRIFSLDEGNFGAIYERPGDAPGLVERSALPPMKLLDYVRRLVS